MIEQPPKTARIVGRFDACGRVRSHDEAAKAKRRADYDKWLAGRCEGLGINAYRRRDEVTAVDLLSQGEIAITLPPVYCNRRFFQTVAASENAQHLRLATLFFDPANGPGSGLQVYEVVLRSKQGKAHVADYHRAHMDFITEAGRAIKHLKRRGLIETLFVARHPRPCANGWIIDDHVHFLFYLERGTLQEIRDYLGDLIRHVTLARSPTPRDGEDHHHVGRVDLAASRDPDSPVQATRAQGPATKAGAWTCPALIGPAAKSELRTPRCRLRPDPRITPEHIIRYCRSIRRPGRHGASKSFRVAALSIQKPE